MANSNTATHYWLYVLLLEENKYYVGITSKTPEVRFKQHLDGFASAAWTRKYKPLKILDTKDLGIVTLQKAQEYENKVVRKYIKKYGIDNVRGGDIATTEELIVRFGWIFSKIGWEAITVIVFLLLIIWVLVFHYGFK